MITLLKRVNFISIPRSASQSIHNAFKTEKFMNHKSIKVFPDRSLPSFAIIRHPVDFAMSWYSFHKSKRKLTHLYDDSLEDWCKNGFFTHWKPEECEPMGITHALNQFDYVSNEEGDLEVQHLVRYEHLISDMAALCYVYDIKLPPIHSCSISKDLEIPDCMEPLLREMFPQNFELYEMANEKSS